MLKFSGKLFQTGQISYEHAQFMTYIDGNYYFYSDNKCFQTDENFYVTEERKINFPFYVRQQYENYTKFENDYPQWFVTCECNGKHYSNVFDKLYEFKKFEATPLTVIPDYPIDQKQNHKVMSAAGQLFATNGRSIFLYDPLDKSFNIVNTLKDCIMLRLHNMNGQILVRDNQNRKLYILDLNYQFVQITDRFANRDLIIANSRYLIQYYNNFCITHCEQLEIVFKETNIQNKGDDIKRVNYILKSQQWDITDQTFIKLLGLEKSQIVNSSKEFQMQDIPEEIKQLENSSINQSFVQQLYFGLTENQKLTKNLTHGYIKLLLLINKQDTVIQYITKYKTLISFVDFTKIFHINDIDNFLRYVEQTQENLNDFFDQIEDEQVLFKLLGNDSLRDYYLKYCIESNKVLDFQNTQTSQIIKLLFQRQYSQHLNQFLYYNYIQCLQQLPNYTYKLYISYQNFSPEAANILFQYQPKLLLSLIAKLNFHSILPIKSCNDVVCLSDYLVLKQMQVPAKLDDTTPYIMYIKQKLQDDQPIGEQKGFQLPAYLLKYKKFEPKL
ncbi:Conserved_hypothetical protein [Hexamita inflata]|uniref:Uncharacterized protein n=1 Tax=Hexamita inflata TaxID=28002 RepID=A0AA86PXL7_9EUKA|nr:Conserved hypothetical protein [Hexamita inflata]